MKRLLPLVTLLLLSLTLAGAASAQTKTPRVDRRQAHQHERIRQGVRSGELTPRQARFLRRGQAQIRRMEARFKADGRITRAERRQLLRMQERQNARIYRMKHDGARRTWRV